MKRQHLYLQHIIHNDWGFTIVEVLLAIVILVIAILPMVNAFAPAQLSTEQAEEQTVLTNQARSALHGLFNLPFQTLDDNKTNPAALLTMLGDQATAGASVSVTDVSGGAGGLLELKVTLKNVSLQTRKANR